MSREQRIGRRLSGVERRLDRVLSKGFNPDEPRDPRGSPTGGQWASGGVLLGEAGVPSLDGKYARVWIRTVSGSRDSGMGRVDTQYLHIMGTTPEGKTKTLMRGEDDETTSRKYTQLTGKPADYSYGYFGGTKTLPKFDQHGEKIMTNTLRRDLRKAVLFLKGPTAKEDYVAAVEAAAKGGIPKARLRQALKDIYTKAGVKKVYNPKQPRAPKGDPTGGRWINTTLSQLMGTYGSIFGGVAAAGFTAEHIILGLMAAPLAGLTYLMAEAIMNDVYDRVANRKKKKGTSKLRSAAEGLRSAVNEASYSAGRVVSSLLD